MFPIGIANNICHALVHCGWAASRIGCEDTCGKNLRRTYAVTQLLVFASLEQGPADMIGVESRGAIRLFWGHGRRGFRELPLERSSIGSRFSKGTRIEVTVEGL